MPKDIKPATIQPTDITILIDSSGSMVTIRDAMVEGILGFIAKQKLTPGACDITIQQFQSAYVDEILSTVLPTVSVFEAEWDGKSFAPAGGTPLYDAIAKTVQLTTKRLTGTNKRPVFIIVTDGQENASREWKRDQVFALLDAVQQGGWEVVYLGANQDAYAVGQTIGTRMANTSNYRPDRVGTQALWNATAANMADLRGGVTMDMAYSTEQRAAMEGVASTPEK